MRDEGNKRKETETDQPSVLPLTPTLDLEGIGERAGGIGGGQEEGREGGRDAGRKRMGKPCR